jgi:hypothetical protein
MTRSQLTKKAQLTTRTPTILTPKVFTQLYISQTLNIPPSTIFRWAKAGCPISSGPEAVMQWKAANIHWGNKKGTNGTPRSAQPSQVKIISAMNEVKNLMNSLARAGRKYVNRNTHKKISVSGQLEKIVGKKLNNAVVYCVLKKFKVPEISPLDKPAGRPPGPSSSNDRYTVLVVQSRGRNTTHYHVIDEHGVCVSVHEWHFEAQNEIERLQVIEYQDSQIGKRLYWRHSNTETKGPDDVDLDETDTADCELAEVA